MIQQLILLMIIILIAFCGCMVALIRMASGEDDRMEGNDDDGSGTDD